MNHQEIIELLTASELTDYAGLSKKEAVENYKSILDELLAKAEKDFAGIIDISAEDINFSNIVEAYLNNDEMLGELYGFLSHLNSVSSSKTTRDITEYFQPKYVAYGTKVGLSYELYEKLVAVEKFKENHNEQQQRCLEKLIQNMEMSGVHLKGKKKERLEEINLELARLSEKFSNNVIDSKKTFFHLIEKKESIADMPKQDLEMAKSEAKKRDMDGWLFTLSPPSIMAVMKYCSDRVIREIFYVKSVQVATEEGYDNQPLVVEILKLRREKAQILEKKNYAEFVLQDRMADSVEDVKEMLNKFATRATNKGKQDVEELKKFAGIEDFQPWDIAYNSNKLRRDKFNIDEKELKKYFPVESVTAGMFAISGKLYGLDFKLIETESYHEDVRSYEVYRQGKLISYFILDLFARPEKRPGAWCNILRGGRKSHEGRIIPIVINVANFGKSEGSEPTLLPHGEVVTMFHEFGHGIHMMMSENDYANTGSMSVEWDFVELPSQLMENWCWQQDSLDVFARHYETGMSIPEELVEAQRASRSFMSGYQLLRQNEFGFLDMGLHGEEQVETVEELNKFCLGISRKHGLLEVPDYYRMYASFGHIFAGGYAAGYYSYLWAEILEADVFNRFKKEGILNTEMGEKFRAEILAAGAKKPGKELFENFMGRGPDPEALMKKKGI